MKRKTNLPYLSPQAFELALLEQTVIAASAEGESIEDLTRGEVYNW